MCYLDGKRQRVAIHIKQGNSKQITKSKQTVLLSHRCLSKMALSVLDEGFFQKRVMRTIFDINVFGRSI
jgi:hypothetical protein